MRNLKQIILINGITIAVIAGGLTGCKSYWWQTKSSERSTGRMVDDKHITSVVKKKLASEPVYKFDDVDVKTFDGVVQLSGFVNNDEQKERAAQIAQQVEGVGRVVNGITLKSEVTSSTGR